MITMVVGQRADGADIAAITLAGQHYEVTSRNGATMKLARKLVVAGLPDSPWQTVGADGGARLHGRSLYGLAKLTVHEDARGIHVVPFEPFGRRSVVRAPTPAVESPAAFRSPPLSLHPDDAGTPPARSLGVAFLYERRGDGRTVPVVHPDAPL